MSMYARAAQFAPFSALHGFHEALVETEKKTDEDFHEKIEEGWAVR